MIGKKQREQLNKIKVRVQELEAHLSSREARADYKLVREYNKELVKLGKVVNLYAEYEKLEGQQQQAKVLLKDKDADLRDLATHEYEESTRELEKMHAALIKMFQKKDENDARSVFMEIRPAAGGDEATIFVGDLVRMYQYYAERKDWVIEIVNLNPGEQGGHKLAVMTISGEDVYGHLKFESGTHRVQRVPKTETQGRLHTSTCTIAVLAEASPADDIEINKADLRIDTYRASGAGGQHINKTDSAVRITHLPTGMVVECQEQRSQHRNKEKALQLLQARLFMAGEEKRRQAETQLRRSLVGSGDRAEKIRTYNFPQNRVTDHRLPLTLYSLTDLMLGDMDPLIEPLMMEERTLLVGEMVL